MFLIERSLDVGGHYESQLLAIRRLCGRNLTVLTHKEYVGGAIGTCSLLPVLVPVGVAESDHELSLEADLRAVKESLSSDTKSLTSASLLVPSGDAYELELAARVIADLPEKCHVSVRLLADRRLHGFSEHALETIRQKCKEGSLKIYTETRDFAEFLSNTYGLCVAGTLALPCSIELLDHMGALRPWEDADLDDLRIFLPGGARFEKGIQLYPEIFKVLRTAQLPVRRISVVFQRPKKPMGTLRSRIELSAFLNSLLSWISPRRFSVVVLPSSLDDASYADEMKKADVVLLPYDRKKYAGRGSGVVVDAVAAGCAILHTEGMGNSEVLCHGNARSFREVADLPKALTELIASDPWGRPAIEARKALDALYEESARILKTQI